MADKLGLIRAQPETVLEWGARVGGGLSDLDARYPKARTWRVEPNAVVIATEPPPTAPTGWAARAWNRLRGPRAPEVTLWSERDLAGLRGAGFEGADLLWANMALHGYDDIPGLLERWQGLLSPSGYLMFSTFGPDTVRELAPVHQAMGWGPATVVFTDMHDLGDMLVHAGFAEPVMDMERLRLSWADAEAMLTELRSLGINAAPGRRAGLRTPRWRGRLVAALEDALRGPDGRLHLSFEIVYGHAFRGRAPARDGLTQVSLGELRAQLPSRRGP